MSAFASAVLNSQGVTHEKNLVDADAKTDNFLRTMAGLGDRLGPLLLQLPLSFSVEGMASSKIFSKSLRKASATPSR